MLTKHCSEECIENSTCFRTIQQKARFKRQWERYIVEVEKNECILRQVSESAHNPLKHSLVYFRNENKKIMLKLSITAQTATEIPYAHL
jgi:hypothetical protein